MKRIKNLKLKIKNFAGFTMIELLIVIAVLGVLAVAVLSAINPIEQINRSRDTGSRADAEQLLGAIDRYYTSMGWYPWFFESCAAANCPLAWTDSNDVGWVDNGGATAVAVMDKLSQQGTAELKAAFVTRIQDTNYNPLWVYNHGDSGDATYACFHPKSASFQTEAMNRCTTGLPPDLDPIVATVCTGDESTVFSCLP
ncbi:hypothetical protein COT64_01635 [Candidatus Shapirobacteria bacterium CG09_land_8_20_14_0_10_39_12]|uniref:Type II secretion system protein GspG C-terminal domain-containing protein n=1 Tax=Candidatus Shapirobacteria bacterium CG09_land_8_20_14_0_10_39_12 TaxID=1974885 RepID=A0A2H0WPS8_9BACT|nr:MAG: hypothetical protein COT64_01635 [Candidatus Shapirobacteria bacterium CG09_land_8_20_14_0_10_39_12]